MISARLFGISRVYLLRTVIVNVSEQCHYSTTIHRGSQILCREQRGNFAVSKASNSTSAGNFIDVIPEPPLPPVAEQVLNALGEPSLSSLGLCSYWPSGWYQSLLETLHVSLDMPWWSAIAATTLVIRLSLFPFIISQRRNLAKYTEAMPTLTLLQERMTKARLSGDYFEMMRVSKEMQDFMQNREVNPLKSMKLLVIQIPIFLSVFAGIRGMTSLPVPSMRTGGLAWFSDLTIPDPYYLLPLLSMSSILLMVETGADMSTQAMTPIMRTLMRGFPCVGFFMVMNMPSALLWYWTVSNFISLVQATILRLPAVRTWLKLPASSKPPPTLAKKRGFVEGFRETMTNSKLLAELEARERLDAKSWQEAGRGHIPRTFAYDPTKSPVRAKGTIVDDDSAVSANTANRRTASGKN